MAQQVTSHHIPPLALADISRPPRPLSARVAEIRVSDSIIVLVEILDVDGGRVGLFYPGESQQLAEQLISRAVDANRRQAELDGER